MSRTAKNTNQMHVPKKVKRAYRRMKKAEDKQALRQLVNNPDDAKGPERDRRSDAWNYL